LMRNSFRLQLPRRPTRTAICRCSALATCNVVSTLYSTVPEVWTAAGRYMVRPKVWTSSLPRHRSMERAPKMYDIVMIDIAISIFFVVQLVKCNAQNTILVYLQLRLQSYRMQSITQHTFCGKRHFVGRTRTVGRLTYHDCGPHITGSGCPEPPLQRLEPR
jgi:hypothetical protein